MVASLFPIASTGFEETVRRNQTPWSLKRLAKTRLRFKRLTTGVDKAFAIVAP